MPPVFSFFAGPGPGFGPFVGGILRPRRLCRARFQRKAALDEIGDMVAQTHDLIAVMIAPILRGAFSPFTPPVVAAIIPAALILAPLIPAFFLAVVAAWLRAGGVALLRLPALGCVDGCGHHNHF